MFEIIDNRRFRVIANPQFPPGNWLLVDQRTGKCVPTHLTLRDDLCELARKMNANPQTVKSYQPWTFRR